ncbi:MAG: hypothetical protein M1825_002767 [Sarcosagium campestre]|nr:MAG: hypothetical protein M1825_002767 [Sarcosagium campestre]
MSEELLSLEESPFTPPDSHHLVIATRKSVYIWTSDSFSSVFESESHGIVAAKKSAHDGGMLAVADSSIVVLHPLRSGKDEKYPLRGGEGEVRILRLGNDSKTLFFTTSLQNSVQSYSLTEARLLEPSPPHPSPPTCIALSPTSHLLISTSGAPPLIRLENLVLRTSAPLLRPAASSTNVVAASFHPERPDIFALGFHDGTVAVYDAIRVFRHETGANGEIGHVRRLHVSVGSSQPKASRTNYDDDEDVYLEDDSSTIDNGGIVAVEFLPGSKAKVVSADVTGKCIFTDFEIRQKGASKVIKTFHARAPVTSLSILPSTSGPRRKSSQGSSKSLTGSHSRDGICLIAVGRVDGKILVVNDSAELLAEKKIVGDGTRVVDVEWMEGSGAVRTSGLPRRVHGSSSSRTQRSSGESQSSRVGRRHPPVKGAKTGSLVLAAGRRTEEQVVAVTEGQNTDKSRHASIDDVAHQRYHAASSERHRSVSSAWEDIEEDKPLEKSYMDLFSPVKAVSTSKGLSSAGNISPKHRRSKGFDGGVSTATSSKVSSDGSRQKATVRAHRSASESSSDRTIGPRSRVSRKHDSERPQLGAFDGRIATTDYAATTSAAPIATPRSALKQSSRPLRSSLASRNHTTTPTKKVSSMNRSADYQTAIWLDNGNEPDDEADERDHHGHHHHHHQPQIPTRSSSQRKTSTPTIIRPKPKKKTVSFDTSTRKSSSSTSSSGGGLNKRRGRRPSDRQHFQLHEDPRPVASSSSTSVSTKRPRPTTGSPPSQLQKIRTLLGPAITDDIPTNQNDPTATSSSSSNRRTARPTSDTTATTAPVAAGATFTNDDDKVAEERAAAATSKSATTLTDNKNSSNNARPRHHRTRQSDARSSRTITPDNQETSTPAPAETMLLADKVPPATKPPPVPNPKVTPASTTQTSMTQTKPPPPPPPPPPPHQLEHHQNQSLSVHPSSARSSSASPLSNPTPHTKHDRQVQQQQQQHEHEHERKHERDHHHHHHHHHPLRQGVCPCCSALHAELDALREGVEETVRALRHEMRKRLREQREAFEVLIDAQRRVDFKVRTLEKRQV